MRVSPAGHQLSISWSRGNNNNNNNNIIIIIIVIIIIINIIQRA